MVADINLYMFLPLALERLFPYGLEESTLANQMLQVAKDFHVTRVRRGIEKILSRIGVRHAQVYSSPGRIVTGKGLQLDDIKNDVDKAEFVREARTNYMQLAFAGDGPPDVGAALLVPPKLRFARRYLAEGLRQRDEALPPFESWSRDVVGRLLSQQSA